MLIFHGYIETTFIKYVFHYIVFIVWEVGLTKNVVLNQCMFYIYIYIKIDR